MADRQRAPKFTAALLAAAAGLWVAAPAAWAGGGHRERAHRELHHPSAHRGLHGWHCGRHREARAHRAHRTHGGHRARRAAPYYCKPCGHRYHSRSHFYGHLVHHHHLPFWAIPFALVHWAATWTYHG